MVCARLPDGAPAPVGEASGLLRAVLSGLRKRVRFVLKFASVCIIWASERATEREREREGQRERERESERERERARYSERESEREREREERERETETERENKSMWLNP